MPRCVTYSPAYTIVPTYECFNRCTYCNFRREPGQDAWLSLAEAETIFDALQGTGTIEILILSGEVHSQSDRRRVWFQRIYDLCQLALSKGFLPHTNAGPLSFAEMEALKMVNVSMGLMLEQTTYKLLETVHKHAPSKVPELRVRQLEQAGELQIPFTTGLLLGIGETVADWQDTLETIARLHRHYGHIQEVILQPHSPGNQQTGEMASFPPEKFLNAIAIARQILPDEIAIQIPPNLIASPEYLIACLEAGASDLGGISPKDEVNPDYPHPRVLELSQTIAAAGFKLVPRLPVYPQFRHWLRDPLRQAICKRDRENTTPQMPKTIDNRSRRSLSH